MKKLTKLLLVSFMFLMTLSFATVSNVYAAGFSVSRSASTVAPGGRFTVTVVCSGASGQFNVSASNGSLSASSFYLDGGSESGSETKSITVTAGSSGTVSVSVNGYICTYGSRIETNTTKSVSVAIVAPSAGGSNNSNNSSSSSSNSSAKPAEVVKKSADNNLASLTVSAGTLSPAFDADTTNYEVNLDAKATKISVDAKAKDAKASVSGIGEHELKVGPNTLQVVCKAENGATKTYTITVNVDETPQVYTSYGKQRLGVVRNLNGLGIPNSFEETKVKVDGEEVTAYHSNNMNKTIVYMVNDKGEKNFYLYSEKEGITSKFVPVAILGRNAYIVDVDKEDVQLENTTYKTIEIDGNSLKGWVFNDDENYALVRLMNEKGKEVTYQYEKSENSLQLYHEVEQEEQSNIVTYIFVVTTALCAIAAIAFYSRINVYKRQLREKIKETNI